jgi:predicted dienelactone hydrolase
VRLLPVVLLSFVTAVLAVRQAGGGDLDYAARGSFTVRQIDHTWHDDARKRDIPLRIRLPESREPVPTILFSHGLGGSVAGGTEWAEQWASRGFAVIHVQHPGSDESIWKDKPAGERMAGLRSGADLQQFLARIADIKFVVAELDRRRSKGDPLAAHLNLDRLGMSGHSFGAITTLYLGGQRAAVAVGAVAAELSEPRFTAFLAFSPQAGPVDPQQQFAAFTRPALLVTGTLDGQPFPGIGASPPQRLVPFDAMAAAGNKYLLVLNDADHMYFNGTHGLRDIGTVGRDNVDFAAAEAQGYPLVRAVTTAYWQAYLRDDAAAARWLKDGGAGALVDSRGSFRTK